MKIESSLGVSNASVPTLSEALNSHSALGWNPRLEFWCSFFVSQQSHCDRWCRVPSSKTLCATIYTPVWVFSLHIQYLSSKSLSYGRRGLKELGLTLICLVVWCWGSGAITVEVRAVLCEGDHSGCGGWSPGWLLPLFPPRGWILKPSLVVNPYTIQLGQCLHHPPDFLPASLGVV